MIHKMNQWLAALILLMCGTAIADATEVVRSVYQLSQGAVIKIYPKAKYGSSLCGNQDYALSSYANGGLFLYKYAGEEGASCEWTIIDTDNGYFYLRNGNGAYWTTRNVGSGTNCYCCSDEKSAVRVRFTWDSKNRGICFWNEDGLGLNNQNGYMQQFSWYSSPESYDSDTNTTYDVELIKEGTDEDSHYKEIEDGKFKYLLNLNTQTAKLLSNGYSGDIVVPHYAQYEGKDYEINSMSSCALQNCINIDAKYINTAFLTHLYVSEDIQSIKIGDVNNIATDAFVRCEGLKSAEFGNVGTIEGGAFSSAVNMETVSFKGLVQIKEDAFRGCYALKSFTLPSTIRMVEKAFPQYDFCIPFMCYAKDPKMVSIDEYVLNWNIKELYVPKASLEDYKNTSPWTGIANRIYPIAETLVERIEMPQEAVIGKRGAEGKIQLTANVFPEDASNRTIKWSSSMEGVATVDDQGYVTGLSAGEATITAATIDGSGVYATCKVTVKPIGIESVSLLGLPTHLYLGEYVNHIKSVADIFPEDADCRSIQITTSEPDVVRYYPDTDRLYAKAEGQSVITATATGYDGITVSASATITVGNPSGVEAVYSDEQITIKDLMGRTIYRGTGKSANITEPGVYLVSKKDKTIKISIK